MIFDSSSNVFNTSTLLNTSSGHVVNVWRRGGADGYAQTFSNVAGTFTPIASAFHFETGGMNYPAISRVNDTHFLLFYQGGSSHGLAKAIEDNGSGTLSTVGSLTFDTNPNAYNSLAPLGDGLHYANQWWNNTNIVAQIFAVNTSTWAITQLSSALVGSSYDEVSCIVECGDGQHFISFAQTALGVVAQVLETNLSTYALTAVGTPVTIPSSPTNAAWLRAVMLDSTHTLLSVQQDPASPGSFVQLIARDSMTNDLTIQSSPVSGFEQSNQNAQTIILLDAYTALMGWRDFAGNFMEVMVHTVGPFTAQKFLYAGSGDEVFNTPDGTWTSRRSGLATVSKPRFSQYLNRIWMVNGNASIGGNPVETSDGGDFDTTLVPINFPQGDFISAGFEGRVWVADKTVGVIYYSDIVQFTPPTTYTLTYNSAVNFISSLSPQTGETFTALIEVPRALLVFTQNTITRIYGATSVDAYAAYNVGTYSQESIHHHENRYLLPSFLRVLPVRLWVSAGS